MGGAPMIQKFTSVKAWVAAIAILSASGLQAADKGTMMQYFEWNTHAGGEHWNNLANDARHLTDVGITAIWIPPPSKGDGKIWDVGYGIYDPYDLGEFKQKGTVRTKYGTRTELLNAVRQMKANGLQIYADIVMNHLLGADKTERVRASLSQESNRNNANSGGLDLNLYTRFDYAARGGKYSSFTFNSNHFNAVGCSVPGYTGNICKIDGHNWNWEVDTENGNYDYLMGANLDYDHPEVTREMQNWGHWLTTELQLDGYRLDAVKHIKYKFIQDWVGYQRAASGRNLYTVGEFLSGDINKLDNFLAKTGYSVSLFDFPLYYNFQKASDSNGNFDLRTIFNGTLVQRHPGLANTFVDNHDTQYGRDGARPVLPWFRPAAYALILTRVDGYPTVFYGDFYGQPQDKIKPMRDKLDPILRARKTAAYGAQYDYFDDPDLIGWTRTGDNAHPGSGLAVLVTDRSGGSKRMYVGTENRGETWVDVTGGIKEAVTIESSGWATFRVNPGSVSVWLNRSTQDAWRPQAGQLVSLTFDIRHGRLADGQRVLVTGTPAALGAWNPALAPVPTESADGLTSTLTVEVPAGTQFEFKAVKVDTTTGKALKWNEGQDYYYTASGTRPDQLTVFWKDVPDFVE
jgi:alpha-amylase